MELLGIFSNWSIEKILGVGLSGFGFLLMFMAFQLIRFEQKRKGNPRVGITRMIYVFFIVSIVNIGIVGFFGFKQYDENNRLQTSHKAKQNVMQQEIERLRLISYVEEMIHQEKPEVNSTEFQNNVEKKVDNITALADSLNSISPELAEQENKKNIVLMPLKNYIKADTIDTELVERHLKSIKLNADSTLLQE